MLLYLSLWIHTFILYPLLFGILHLFIYPIRTTNASQLGVALVFKTFKFKSIFLQCVANKLTNKFIIIDDTFSFLEKKKAEMGC